MELKWLEDLTALARTRSFSRAAAERNVTQPAFSRRIRALENWLGVTLVDRSVFPIALTRYGTDFLPHAMEIVANATAVRQDFRMLSIVDKRQVKIITLHTLSIHVVPGIVAPFLARNRQARVELVPSVQGVDAHFDALSSGLAHILVAYPQQRPSLESDGYEERLIARDLFVPVVSKGFVDEHGLPDLHGHERLPFVGYSPLTFSQGLVSPATARLGERLNPVAEAPLGETLKALVRRSLGIAWLPLTSIAAEVESGTFVRLNNPELEVPIEIRAWRHRGLGHRLAARFWDQMPRLDG